MNKADIRVRFTEEQAKEMLEDIKNKICDVDLDELCKDDVKVENKDDETASIYKKVIQAIRCGLVEWDEDKGCMVQHLIKPLQAGEIKRTDLYFRNHLKLRDSKEFKSDNRSEVTIKSLANITACPTQVIEELQGQDLTIAIGCMGFFDK